MALAAGNMTNDAINTYTYDAENRITSVSGGLATYSYLGALRVKRNSGGTTVYVYSGTVPIAEYAAGAQLNQPNKEYIYSGGQLLATIDASTGLSYQYPDHLSTRVEADASGCVLRRFGHYPYGEQWYETLSPTQNDPCTGTTSKWDFTSYERDSESALDYAQFRFGSSRLGRFMSQDLLGGELDNPESLDLYTYVLNDPSNLTDATGMTPFLGCLLNDVGDCTAGPVVIFNFGGDIGNINACTGGGLLGNPGLGDYFCAATHGGTQEFLTAIEKNGFRDPIKEGLDPIADMYGQYVKDAVCSYATCPNLYREVGRIPTWLGDIKLLAPLELPAFLGPIYDRKSVSVPKRHPPTAPH